LFRERGSPVELRVAFSLDGDGLRVMEDGLMLMEMEKGKKESKKRLKLKIEMEER
jgi:hypothetical protein